MTKMGAAVKVKWTVKWKVKNSKRIQDPTQKYKKSESEFALLALLSLMHGTIGTIAPIGSLKENK